MTALVLMHHGLLLSSIDCDAAYAMLQSLAQSTCKGNGTGAAAWHCGQLPGVHNHLFQGGHQIVSSKESPTLYTESSNKNHTRKLQT